MLFLGEGVVESGVSGDVPCEGEPWGAGQVALHACWASAFLCVGPR